jgi:stage II sporulation protein AA (anti-sigma F factor antagonist)
MAILTKHEGNTAVVTLSGRLDAVTSPEYRAKLQELIDGGATRVVVDFSALTYMSSAGVGELLVSSNLVRAKQGKMCLANVPKNVVSVFEMCGIKALLDMRPSVEEAVAAVA